MNGFEGPFHFVVDDEGTEVPWDQVSDAVRAELEEAGRHNPENSKLYSFKVAVLEHPHRLEKHHDWSAVSRVCIQVKLPSSAMTLAGVSPRNKKASDVFQNDLGIDATVSAEGRLFDLLNYKLNLSSFAKQNASEQRYAVLNSFNRRVAQWIYSRGWPFLDFTKYLYVVVPNGLSAERRVIKVSVKAVRPKNVELTQVGLFEEPVSLPA
ncbi:hypothetical protein [Pseudorhodoferax sp. Leaf265]|uniref:hypothetical protein n=1 Tax=Pseudorhodoferax sp. Leaf265 TaxID=1736315 RepID=UPI0006F246CF|nr:hypothetical protein [Pseudorhodoferax sp. Leaf265]KQP15566.1 hypothetical protein ASF45_28640 [Pseudorhodoferax sp. Leaf265]